MDTRVDDTLFDTVRYLGSQLGEIVKQHLGEQWLENIERVRKQGRKSYQGDENATQELQTLFKQMPDEDLLTVGRAFAQFLNLANLAEQEHTVVNLQDQDPVEQFLSRLKRDNLSTEMPLADAVKQLSIELVLTAHPTEVTRRTLIYKYARLGECLAQLYENPLNASQRKQVERRIAELISQAWHSDEIRAARPTPVDEAQWGFSVIESSLWHAVPEFIRKLDNQLASNFALNLPIDSVPVKFASWMGGDRDGNPFVTSKVTEEVLLLARKRAASLFEADITKLFIELSMSDCSDELRAYVGENEREPYRAVLGQLKSLFASTQDSIEAYLAGSQVNLASSLISQNKLVESLELCYRSLASSGMKIVADGLLLDTIRRAHCFGVSLLKLDIRQDSDRHDQVFSELTRYLGLGDYSEWSEEDKQAFLLRELTSKRPLIPHNWQPSDDVQEVLNTCKIIAQQDQNALGIYIISMARSPSDVLEVHLLLQEAGITWPMPVAPLFETLDDLNNANDSMTQLLEIDWYRGFIQNHQYVMIGYSDSAKDAGALAAGWAQYQAQEALVNLAAKHNVTLTLFHGRGGTIGRGGLPAHGAILSQPPGSCLGGLRVTEQGETIRFKYGTEPLAQHSLGLYASAILEALMLPPPAPKAQWREVITEMAANGRDNYRNIVRHDENFVPYFRSATPELELSKLPLGSRPSKRKPNGGVESLRAIPWIFAWAQNRLVLPAWLGVMKAFATALENGHKEMIAEMKQEWPFFASRLSMLDMVFMKANPRIAAIYDQELVPDELRYFGENLRAELADAQKLLLELLGQKEVMEKDPAGRKSMEIRAHYLEPLQLMQVELLKRARAAGESEMLSPSLERALMVSIAGVATGLRNTG